MSFWGRITGAISRAGDAIRHAGQSAANQAVHSGSTAFDAAKSSGVFAAGVAQDRSVIFTHGWKQVFSGDMQSGISNVGYGLAQIATGSQPPAWIAERFNDVIGDAMLWVAQQLQTTKRKPCYTAFRAQVQAGLAHRDIKWADAMDAKLRDFVTTRTINMIDLSC